MKIENLFRHYEAKNFSISDLCMRQEKVYMEE